MLFRCHGAPCQASNRNGTAHRGAHGDNCEVQCGSSVRKKRRFTHGRANLRGDVSGKRFSTHAGEGNVAGVAQELLSDGTGCTVTWVQSRDTATEYSHRALSQGTLPQDTVTGYRHRVLPQGTATGYPSRSTRHGKHCLG